MLFVVLAMIVILLIAAAVVVLASHDAGPEETERFPVVGRLRARVPALPVITEDEDLHLRR